MALPHKPLLFLNASLDASQNCLVFGIGPSNWLLDKSTDVKLINWSKVDGIEPESALWERFKISMVFKSPSCYGMSLVRLFWLRSR